MSIVECMGNKKAVGSLTQMSTRLPLHPTGSKVRVSQCVGSGWNEVLAYKFNHSFRSWRPRVILSISKKVYIKIPATLVCELLCERLQSYRGQDKRILHKHFCKFQISHVTLQWANVPWTYSL